MVKSGGTRRRSRRISERRGSQDNNSLSAAVIGGLSAALAWCYWSTITDLFGEWQRNDDYSAGQLVPFVAIFLVWRERKKLAECVIRPHWWAISIVLLALAARTYGLLFIFESAERYSLVLAIAGLVLMVAGRQVFRRVFWILLILFLMVPFPGRIHNMISGPLQSMASAGAAFVLEAFMRVSRQGVTIYIYDSRLVHASLPTRLHRLFRSLWPVLSCHQPHQHSNIYQSINKQSISSSSSILSIYRIGARTIGGGFSPGGVYSNNRNIT